MPKHHGEMQIEPGEGLQHERAAGDVVFADLRTAPEAVQILLQLNVMD
jgi:hypothetical protein